MTFAGQIGLGFAWTCVTLAIAVGFIIILIEFFHLIERPLRHFPGGVRRGILLIASVLWMLLAMIAVVFAWAALFQTLGAFSNLEDAFYLAMVSITTVGFGDVVLGREWRILSGFTAAEGFIIFGLDTAVLFEMMRRLRNDQAMIDR